MVKKVSFFLSLMLILGIFAGCGADQPTVYSNEKDVTPAEQLEHTLEAVEDRIEAAAESLLRKQPSAARPPKAEKPTPSIPHTEPIPTEVTEAETASPATTEPAFKALPSHISVPAQEPPTEMPTPEYIECNCSSPQACTVAPDGSPDPTCVLPTPQFIECHCSSTKDCAVAAASAEETASTTVLPPPAYVECPCPTVEECDSVVAPPIEATEVTLLTAEQAETIALTYMGCTRDQVTELRSEFEYDNGVPMYEVDFIAGGWEYEFDIHGETGEILAFIMEPLVC